MVAVNETAPPSRLRQWLTMIAILVVFVIIAISLLVVLWLLVTLTLGLF